MRSGPGSEVADPAAPPLHLPLAPATADRTATTGLGRRLALPLGTIGILVGCLLAWRQALRSGVFDDTFWHRATGVWILDHHRVLSHDVFSYTVTGRSWITPEWGYGVLLAQSIRWFGPVGFWLLSAGVATLTVICVAVLARLHGAGWLWTGLLCMEAGAAIALFLDDRPQMVSYLFLALLLLLLTAARRHRGLLWCVPVLFVLWANMHGSFLLGLLVLLIEAVFAFVPVRLGRVSSAGALTRSAASLALVGAALGTLVNPFGPRVYRAALGVTFNTAVRQFIGEWQSPNFHNTTILVVTVAPVAATVLYIAMSNRPVPALELLLAGLLLVATLNAVRFLPYFAIVWCAMAAQCSPLPQEQLRPSLLTWPIAAVLALAMLQGPWVPAGQPAPGLPVAAATSLTHRPGRVFSTYLWNDYLIWRGIPVFIDGRAELYTGTPVFNQYLEVNDLSVNPDKILRSYDVRYVLWPPGQALSVYLARDPNWRLIRQSRTSLLFEYAAK